MAGEFEAAAVGADEGDRLGEGSVRGWCGGDVDFEEGRGGPAAIGVEGREGKAAGGAEGGTGESAGVVVGEEGPNLGELAIPTKPNSIPQASRTRFRREAEQ